MSGAAAVNIKEIDLSTRVAGFAGVYGAILVASKKGPSVPTLVTSDSQFLSVFTPDETIKVGDDLANYSALAFLEKSNTLWVKRVTKDALYSGAVVKSTTSIYDNVALQTGMEDPTAYVFDSGNDVEAVAEITSVIAVADVAGSLAGEGLLINDQNGSVAFWASVNSSTVPAWASAADRNVQVTVPQDSDAPTVAGLFNTAIDGDAEFSSEVATSTLNITDAVAGVRDDASSNVFTVSVSTQGADAINTVDESILFHASSEGAFGDEIGVKVYNYATNQDMVKLSEAFIVEVYKSSNTVVPVESFTCSRIEGKKDGYGRNIFIENVLEGSNYIRAISNVNIDENITPKDQTDILWLGGGDDGLAPTDSDMINAVQDFSNPDEIYTTLIMDGGYATPAYQLAIDTICKNRKDCVGIFSVPYENEASSDYLNEVIDYRKTTLNLNSSYSALYTPHVKITDRFNDRKIFVAPDGYAAASISATGSNYEMWFPVAGFKRGVLNVEGLVRNYTAGELDTLYNVGINPIRFFSGRGVVIWGQKTLQATPSALDRLNVRLLLIVIEPAIKNALENFLFELNDEGTRVLAKTVVESYMDNIKARRGVTDFKVICDGTNNTPNDVDNNRMILDLYIKPSVSIEYIPFRVVIVSSAVSFDQAAQAI